MEIESTPAPNVQGVNILEWRPDKRVLMILGCLSIVSIMVALDATILIAALPTIARELNGTTSETFWAGTSYLLTSATFQPLLAAISGVFGRREILFLSILLFTAGTIICCRAQDFPAFLAGRAIKGTGGGGIITISLLIITDIIPLHQRPKYYSFTQAAWAVGTVAGPLVGGVIVQLSTWRLLFYINFPFCGIGLVTVPWIVRIGVREQRPLGRMLASIDWSGSLFFMAGTTLFLIALTWGGHQYSWTSYQTLVPLFAGIVMIVVCVVWELRIATAPFMRRNMLQSTALMKVYLCTLVGSLVLYAHVYYIALYLLSVQARSPIMTGVAVLPISCGLTPATALAGLAITRMGSWKWSLCLGWMVTTLAAGLLILLDSDTPTVTWVIVFVVLGLGHGVLINSHNLAVQAISSIEDIAYASALFSFMRSVGLCLGVAVGGTILQSQLRTSLADRGLPTSISDSAEAFIFELVAMPADSPQRIQIISAYAESFRVLFQFMTGISGVAMLLSFTVSGQHSLNKEVQAG